MTLGENMDNILSLLIMPINVEKSPICSGWLKYEYSWRLCGLSAFLQLSDHSILVYALPSSWNISAITFDSDSTKL